MYNIYNAHHHYGTPLNLKRGWISFLIRFWLHTKHDKHVKRNKTRAPVSLEAVTAASNKQEKMPSQPGALIRSGKRKSVRDWVGVSTSHPSSLWQTKPSPRPQVNCNNWSVSGMTCVRTPIRLTSWQNIMACICFLHSWCHAEPNVLIRAQGCKGSVRILLD